MRIKGVKDLDLKTRWSDNDDMKTVNNINDDDDMETVNGMENLSLKVFSFEILIYLRRLRMSRAKELMIKSESDEKGRWSDLKSKALLCCALGSVVDSIIMVALSNRMLDDPKFDGTAAWCFVITSLASAAMVMVLLWLLYTVARPLSFMTRHQLINAVIMLSHNNEPQCLTVSQSSITSDL